MFNFPFDSALVVNINPFGPTPIHAYFCDFGQVQQLDAGALRVLPPEFRVLPQQAIKAKLYGKEGGPLSRL